jgi:hypothetical protein
VYRCHDNKAEEKKSEYRRETEGIQKETADQKIFYLTKKRCQKLEEIV